MFKILTFLVLLIPSIAIAQVGTTVPIFGQDACIWVEEEDGVPLNNYCGKLKVTNGTLTDNGDGSFSLDTGGGAGSGYSTIADEGSNLTQRTTLNFTGSGVSCVDNAGNTRTDCTISASAGSSKWLETTGVGIGTYSNVGINTLLPEHRLDVVGGAKFGPIRINGTGGTITYANGYTIHTFESDDTFTPSASGEIGLLIIGGGGGGGCDQGGGGGAGGLAYGYTTVVAGQAYSVVIGQGGAGGDPGIDCAGVDGGNSEFDTITALGGGSGSGAGSAAGTGGSGGGGSPLNTPRGEGSEGSSGTLVAYFNNGGHGSVDSAGGGGGATNQGDQGGGSPAFNAGDGGDGFYLSTLPYSDALGCYAGGGGGSGPSGYNQGIGYCGGGEASYDSGGSPATAYGSGGGANWTTDAGGGAGAAGVVIVFYLTNPTTFVEERSGNLGLGTVAPVNRLEVDGSMIVGTPFIGQQGPINGMAVRGNVVVGIFPDADSKLTIWGNIGINSTNPNYALDIAGTARTTGGFYSYDGLTTTAGMSLLDNKLALFYGDTPANQLNINSNGNVGINTSNALEKLHVIGNIRTNITGSTQCLQVNSSGVVSGTGSGCGGTGSNPDGGENAVQYNSSGAFTGDESVFSFNGTNVGIGTTNGRQKLEVVGNTQANTFIASAPSATPILYADGDSNTGIVLSGPDIFEVHTGGLNAVTINSAQNVGIGSLSPATAPQAQLHIVNSRNINTLRVDDEDANDSSPIVVDSVGNIGIGTTVTNYGKISIDADNTYGQIRLDGDTGGCLMIRDTDNAGWTECYTLDGVFYCSIDNNGVCDGS